MSVKRSEGREDVELRRLERLARTLRADCLRMVHRARTSHIGSCLSAADILAVLYGQVLRVRPDLPNWPNRDRFIMSKGHAAALMYAALARTGFFDPAELTTFAANDGQLWGHVTSGRTPGVEFSTGSLGHGLPVATGMALSGKRGGERWRVFNVMSDGECDEGSNWEAILFAAHHELDNLVAIVDCNGIQSLGPVEETIRLEPLAEKFRAFGWSAVEVDGHDIRALHSMLSAVPATARKPTAVIARTVKGHGVDFMAGQVLWHYRPPNDEELNAALRQLGEAP